MPDSKIPDEPLDDIIEMFRNIAENGSEPTRATAPVSTPVERNDSAADASVLGEAASAQDAPAPAPVKASRSFKASRATQPVQPLAAPIPVEPAPARATVVAAPVEPAAPFAPFEAAAAAPAAPVEPAAAALAATEGVVPISTIEKLLSPTPRSAPTPGPYVGLPKPDLTDPSLHSEPDALAAVINGTAPVAAPVAAEPVEGDDVVLTAAASVPPGTAGSIGIGGDGRRRRRGVVIIAGVAAAALLAVGGAYALEHHSPSKNVGSQAPRDTTTFGATPSSAPTLTPSPSATPSHHPTHVAVVPPSIAVPSSVPTVAASTNAAAIAAAQASQSAAMASASASLSAAIVAKEQQLAKHYAAVVTSYYKTVAPLAQGFAGVISNAPTISPKDTPTAADADAFYRAVTQATHYYNAVRAVKAPSTLAGAQSRLLAAMASARTNLINGQNVALNGQSCSAQSCTYADQRGWTSYTSTLSNTWSFPQAAITWQTAVSKLLAGKG